MIISDASEYRGVLLYQTANRFSNFSPEGRQRPMNVPSRVRVTSRFGASRAMAAALRLGWAPGDFPPLLPTQADGRRAHMHPARGTGIVMMCQCHQLVPVQWPLAGHWHAGHATRVWPGCPVPMRRRAGPGRPQLGVARRSLGRSSVCASAVYKHEARLGVEHSMARIRSRKGVADLHTAQHIYARLVFIRFRFRFRVRFNGFR